MATKRYWTISEVAEQFDVNASLLRYWEKEFTALDPKKQGSGKRAYTAKDIEIIGVLHDLRPLDVRVLPDGAVGQIEVGPVAPDG